MKVVFHLIVGSFTLNYIFFLSFLSSFQSRLSYEDFIQHPNPLRIDFEPQQTFQHCCNYPKYPLPHCLHLSTWESGKLIFFLMAKIAQAVWLHREVTIVVALISHFLPSNCLTQKGIENQTKVCLGAANKTYPTLAATTGSLLLLITLWHRHTNTHMQTQKWMAHQQTQQTQTDLAFFWHLPQ